MRLHNLREGYKILPAIDKEKYQQRNGLEGPFSTLSGKVVYYDPKEGSYYDPDTDMYMTYDEFQNYDKDYSGMKDERDEVKEADETKYGIVRYPDTAISYIKNDGNGWEHIFDKSYGFKGPVDKADLKYAKKITKEKIPSRMFGMNEEEDPYYASQTIMDEDPPLGINYDYANLPKVNWDKYSTKAIKEFLSVIENLDFESGYYGDFDDFDDMHFNAAQWIEKNVLAKRQDKSVKEGGLRPGFAKDLRNAELNKGKGAPQSGKTTGPDDYDFLKYKNKKKKETSEAVLDEAPGEVHTVYINGKKWKSFYKKESADKAAATIAARGKKTEVKSGPAPTYKAPAPTKAPEPKPQDPKQKAAMDKALKSIEMSFGPERKEITDQVLAMIRTAAMLNNPNWADRAWGNVEKYGIKDKADLVRELQMMIADEQKVKDDDLDGHIYGPDSNIKQMRKALDSIS